MSEILKKLKNVEEKKKDELKLVVSSTTSAPKTLLSELKNKKVVITFLFVIILAVGTLSYFKIKNSREVALIQEKETTHLSPEVINNELLNFIRTKNSKGAIAYLANLKDGIPKENLEVVNNYGVILRLDQKSYESIRILSDAISKWPKSEYLFNNRGTAYLSIGETDSAIIDFKKSLEINSDYPEPHLNLAITYEILKKWSYAYHHYATFIQSGGAKSGTEEIIKRRMVKIVPMVLFEQKKERKRK